MDMNITIRGIALAAAIFSTAAVADRSARYEITVTNLTPGQTFTPILVAAHSRHESIFSAGAPASDALAALAESGSTAEVTQELVDAGVPESHIATILGPDPAPAPPLTGPGRTASIEIRGPRRGGKLSVAAMLIPTNDTFMALNSVNLPRRGQVSYIALAYDAGTEANDQNCANIPGPRCGGEGNSAPADSDEGIIVVSNGFHDKGTQDADGNEILGPSVYDWRNPVARITIRRIRH